ncbi:hypothetical protein M0R04_04590 [Candidatus Dojkabacteria bacterium]|jgi:hypothetical protein|nr:hypothetical protein [Candidatus Dojkabacteria bacterium]
MIKGEWWSPDLDAIYTYPEKEYKKFDYIPISSVIGFSDPEMFYYEFDDDENGEYYMRNNKYKTVREEEMAGSYFYFYIFGVEKRLWCRVENFEEFKEVIGDKL